MTAAEIGLRHFILIGRKCQGLTICRHIFQAAMQLNLEKLLDSLFYERWRKNPCEEKLINAYINFSTSNIYQQSSSNQSNVNQDQDY